MFDPTTSAKLVPRKAGMLDTSLDNRVKIQTTIDHVMFLWDLNVERENDVDVVCSVFAGDGHPQDQSDQSLHLLLLPQPCEMGEVGYPGGVEEEAQLVSVVASQSPQHAAEVSLHEDPGCERVGPEPARQGKFEENVLQSVSDGLSGGLTEEGSSQVRIIFRVKMGWRGRV